MKVFVILSALLFPFCILIAQNNNTIEIPSISVGEIKVAGFSLKSEKNIYIEATGAGGKPENGRISMMDDPDHMFAYAWIINAKTRDLVWRMSLKNTKKVRKSHFNRTFKGNVNLPEGDYEVYYSAVILNFGFIDEGFFSLGKLFNKLFSGEEWYEEDKREWNIRIDDVEKTVDNDAVKKYHKKLKDQSVVSLTDLYDSEFRQEGFELKKRGSFEIYAIGEAYEEKTFDYGWIIDASTSEKVWETLINRSDHAGGAIKNKVWRETITLDPGEYWIYFIMDDSHSPQSLNANPPYDPDFYGITLSGIPGKYDPQSINLLLKQRVVPIVELTKIGDNEYVQEGFILSAPTQIRIYAIGEGRKGEMFDYAWITDLKTGDKVWEMTFNRTRHAGGADKNRLVDEVINLAAGSYIVHYITDDSHSYRNWNNTKPYNPSSWGVTIYPADPKYDSRQIQKLEDGALSEQIIAQIIRVRDGRFYQERFRIKKESLVRIYAIGEGDWDEMYDYGWLENAVTGKKVWEMNYELTDWAGGAKKNRKVDQKIELIPGQYILYYKTDDTHSFFDWNDDPPEDPIHYGITIYEVTD